MRETAVDNDTRLEILKFVAEMNGPIGAEALVVRLAGRGINLTADAIRYHLRMLDQQGFTSCVGKKGRVLTQSGWSELRSSRVDTRLGRGLARHETMAQQVTFDPCSGTGRVVGSLSIFPSEYLSLILQQAVRASESGIGISARMALVGSGEKVSGVPVPPGKVGLVTLSSATMSGVLIRQGYLVRLTYAGVVEIADWRPYRFVDVLRYGYGSLDSVETLIKHGSTRVGSIVEHGHGLVIADIRELIGAAREEVCDLLGRLQGCGLGGVLAVGQMGQPILGIPVRDHTFGVALLGGINPALPSYEQGIPLEYHLVECLVDYASLSRAEELLPEAERAQRRPAGRLVTWDRSERQGEREQVVSSPNRHPSVGPVEV